MFHVGEQSEIWRGEPGGMFRASEPGHLSVISQHHDDDDDDGLGVCVCVCVCMLLFTGIVQRN